MPNENRKIRPGLYLVHYTGPGDRDLSKGKGGGYYPIETGTIKIGLSKNDVSRHWSQYFARYGRENIEWRVVFEHSDYEICKRIERYVHQKLKKFKVQRQGNPGRKQTKEWMYGTTEAELLAALREGVAAFARNKKT